MYDQEDLKIHNRILHANTPNIDFVQKVYEAIKRYIVPDKKIGGYAIFNPIVLRKSFSRDEQENPWVQPAIALLIEHGIIEQWQNYIKLGSFDKAKEKIEAAIQMRSHAGKAMLGQMEQYIMNPNPSQELLTQLLHTEI